MELLEALSLGIVVVVLSSMLSWTFCKEIQPRAPVVGIAILIDFGKPFLFFVVLELGHFGR